MPSYSTLALAFAIMVVVRAIPVDEISVRNGVAFGSSGMGGQASGGSVSSSASSCTGSVANCGLSDPSGITLAKIDSENAGNGGSAPSGASSGAAPLSLVGGTEPTHEVPVGSGFSGAGGEAPGGSVVDNHPALIELGSGVYIPSAQIDVSLSDNAGQGGVASSGNSSGLVS